MNAEEIHWNNNNNLKLCIKLIFCHDLIIPQHFFHINDFRK